MKSFTLVSVLAAACASVALAVPVEDRQAPYVPCTGLYSTPQCCATDVLGVADLDCGPPPETPTDADNFSAVCADIGQRARCCVLPVLGQGLLCDTPIGVDN